MAIKKITIQDFISLGDQHPMIDVRSEGEYEHAHIPAAHSMGLFNNEERKVVGTAYKQEGKKIAIKLGLDFFGVKMKAMVEEAERIINEHTASDAPSAGTAKNSNIVLVYCWRGGMRSAGVAWMLDLYGFEVYTLIGGYKSYRTWALEQFNKDYQLTVIGGYTGSGKTGILHQLHQQPQLYPMRQLADRR